MRVAWVFFVAMACSGGDDSDDGSGTDDASTDTGTEDSTPDTSCPAPSVAMGTGLFGYEPIEEGQPLEMVYGDQGGWHFDLAAEIVGFGPEIAFEGGATVVSSGEVIARAEGAPLDFDLSLPGLASWDEDSCSGSFFAQRLFIDDVEAGTSTLIQRMCSLDQEDVTLTLDVVDPGTGTTYSDSVTVYARLDPNTPCP